MPLLADGSAEADAGEVVRVDRSNFVERHRYRCPNGHSTWEPTNSHIWCAQCQQAARQGANVEAEHYHIVDEKTGEKVNWSRVVLVE